MEHIQSITMIDYGKCIYNPPLFLAGGGGRGAPQAAIVRAVARPVLSRFETTEDWRLGGANSGAGSRTAVWVARTCVAPCARYGRQVTGRFPLHAGSRNGSACAQADTRSVLRRAMNVRGERLRPLIRLNSAARDHGRLPATPPPKHGGVDAHLAEARAC
jgi:hypothetical protein